MPTWRARRARSFSSSWMRESTESICPRSACSGVGAAASGERAATRLACTALLFRFAILARLYHPRRQHARDRANLVDDRRVHGAVGVDQRVRILPAGLVQ